MRDYFTLERWRVKCVKPAKCVITLLSSVGERRIKSSKTCEMCDYFTLERVKCVITLLTFTLFLHPSRVK